MPLLRSLTDKTIVRAFRGKAFESKFLRDYFLRTYDISVGMYTSAGAFDRWRIPPGSRIGRYCSIAETARLVDANHPVTALSTNAYFYLKALGLVDQDRLTLRPPVIEDDVWLSHNSTILPSCERVGRGAVIGAGAIVVRDVPRYAVMVGCPARLIRYRFSPEVIAAVEATQWWLLDTAALKKGCDAAPGFMSVPTVEGAAMFRAALGLDFDPAALDPGPALPHKLKAAQP